MEDGMNIAFLSLGGNMGNRLEILRRTARKVEKRCGVILLRSSIYETEAWGSASEKKFLNQVIKIQTPLSAGRLLKELLTIEKEGGRTRSGERNSDRRIDVDILFYNHEQIQRDDLHIPHPRLHLRKFVLVPLHEIQKEFIHPTLKKNIAALLKTTPDTLEVKRLKSLSRPLFICIEGNIGSGKTTLAKALAKKKGAEYLAEQFEDLRLLPLFYSKPRPYAFSLEYAFLLSRFEQLAALHVKDQDVVSDFSIHKSLWFAKTNLRPGEYRLFKKHFSNLSEHVPIPDLIIHLRTGVHHLKRNITERGRSFEQNISINYLTALDKSYRRGMKHLKGVKKLEIAIPEYHTKLELSSIKIIEKYIHENFG